MLSLPKHPGRTVSESFNGATRMLRQAQHDVPFVLIQLITILLASLPALPARAQVPNDDIEHRRRLQAEETVTSSTTGCTVQWSCVDERLTGKCIEYHNDQWFEFQPPAAGTYYANVGSQHCRDVRGVQLVVLTGTPCQPATYRVLSCTSLGTQDDLFVVLPDLQAGQPYLLNVDGYLKDYCNFTLQLSRQARGVPAAVPPAAPTTAPDVSRLVQLHWTLPDSLATARACRVLRREQHEARAHELAQVPVARTTLGQPQTSYQRPDTLAAPGIYLYQVVAESEAGPPVLLQQRWVTYSAVRPVLPGTVRANEARLTLPLARYPRRAWLAVYLRDAATGRPLRTLTFANEPGIDNQVYAENWVEEGVRQVAVEIVCKPPHGPTSTDRLVLAIGL